MKHLPKPHTLYCWCFAGSDVSSNQKEALRENPAIDVFNNVDGFSTNQTLVALPSFSIYVESGHVSKLKFHVMCVCSPTDKLSER